MSHQPAEEKKVVVDNTEKPLPPMPPSPPKLERVSSIDAEPKTLLGDELHVAREAALQIIKSHTKEEALKIFLTGLVPVGNAMPKEDVVLSDSDDNE